MHPIRRPAVSGAWYPGTAVALAAAVDEYLAAAGPAPRLLELRALIVPHAGLIYSGLVAAHAYRQLEGRHVETLILVGPSHFVAFEGVAVYRQGGFDSPLGVVPIDAECADRLIANSPLIVEHPQAHAREHSLEMQLPFVRRLLPHTSIVPLVVGRQTRDIAIELGKALAAAVLGTGTVLVASSDLSHFNDRRTAEVLDRRVMATVEQFNPDELQRLLEHRPEHACGGVPMVAVMRAAKALGARDGVVLHYADSGTVSGDTATVVGYLAAAFGAKP